ncbi:MAG: non-hydrolyzing UDP-N-acetylglucosamine 2-epimerase [Candidatus Heimdallarchaeaceae archaeon]
MNRGIIVTGTRPQIIKTAPIMKAFEEAGSEQILAHTGQHYDLSLDKNIFSDLHIPTPDYSFKVKDLSLDEQIPYIISALTKTIDKEKPDFLISIGDTNSALAAAIAAFKKDCPVAHVEAGVRNYNYNYQEEINRRIIDIGSSYLFPPTQSAEKKLKEEKVMGDILWVGDTMLDVFQKLKPNIEEMRDNIIKNYNQSSKDFALVTLHRREIVDDISLFSTILKQLNDLDLDIIFPIHPRTRKNISESKLDTSKLKNIRLIDPLVYTEFHSFMSSSKLVITDSGGLQKEAFFWNVPCITIRDSRTSWPETLENQANIIIHPNEPLIVETAEKQLNRTLNNDLSVFGKGNASELMVKKLLDEELTLPIR